MAFIMPAAIIIGTIANIPKHGSKAFLNFPFSLALFKISSLNNKLAGKTIKEYERTFPGKVALNKATKGRGTAPVNILTKPSVNQE